MLSPRSSMVTPDALSRSMSRISFCSRLVGVTGGVSGPQIAADVTWAGGVSHMPRRTCTLPRSIPMLCRLELDRRGRAEGEGRGTGAETV